MQRENRIKQKKIHRSLPAQLEWQLFQMKESEKDGESISCAIIWMRNILNGPEGLGKYRVAFVAAICSISKICLFENENRLS